MLDSLEDNLTEINASNSFLEASKKEVTLPNFSGRGIIIAAGGEYLPSAYVVVRLLRHFEAKLPIEIWHAGKEEKPEWAVEAFSPWDVSFHDVMDFCFNRPLKQMQGWPIKSAALLNSKFLEVLFIDADCFPLRNLEFLFDSVEFKSNNAIFWPDSQRHKLVKDGPIWNLTDLSYQADQEFETGLLLLNKEACWQELCLTEWMNSHSSFWYRFVIGDKDTFYLAWRKLKRNYFLAPKCKRFNSILTRHYWTDKQPIADHRTGTSKYTFPYNNGFYNQYLKPYKWRSKMKNIFDEIVQRFITKNFDMHIKYLSDLKAIYEKYK